MYRADWLEMTMTKTKVEVESAKEATSEEGEEEDPWAKAFKAGFAPDPEPGDTLRLRRSVVKYKCPATNGLSLGVWSGRPSLIRRGVFFREIRADQVDSSNLADNSHFRIACHHFTSGIEREVLSADDQVNPSGVPEMCVACRSWKEPNPSNHPASATRHPSQGPL